MREREIIFRPFTADDEASLRGAVEQLLQYEGERPETALWTFAATVRDKTIECDVDGDHRYRMIWSNPGQEDVVIVQGLRSPADEGWQEWHKKATATLAEHLKEIQPRIAGLIALMRAPDDKCAKMNERTHESISTADARKALNELIEARLARGVLSGDGEWPGVDVGYLDWFRELGAKAAAALGAPHILHLADKQAGEDFLEFPRWRRPGPEGINYIAGILSEATSWATQYSNQIRSMSGVEAQRQIQAAEQQILQEKIDVVRGDLIGVLDDVELGLHPHAKESLQLWVEEGHVFPLTVSQRWPEHKKEAFNSICGVFGEGFIDELAQAFHASNHVLRLNATKRVVETIQERVKSIEPEGPQI